MSFIRHSFPHEAVRQHIRSSVGLRSSPPTSTRRCFATEKPSGQAKNPRWLVILLTCISDVASDVHLISFDRLLVSIALGLPISIYLWQRSHIKMPSTKPSTKPRGASQEYSQRAEGDQDVGQNLSSASSSWDEVRYSFSHFIPRAWLGLWSFENPDGRNNAYLTFT